MVLRWLISNRSMLLKIQSETQAKANLLAQATIFYLKNLKKLQKQLKTKMLMKKVVKGKLRITSFQACGLL